MWLSQNSFSWVRRSCCSNWAARFNLRIKLRKNMGFRLFTYGAEKLSSVGSQRANLLREGLAALRNSPNASTQGEHRERISLEDSHFPDSHITSVMCRDTTAVLALSSQAVSISLVDSIPQLPWTRMRTGHFVSLSYCCLHGALTKHEETWIFHTRNCIASLDMLVYSSD